MVTHQRRSKVIRIPEEAYDQLQRCAELLGQPLGEAAVRAANHYRRCLAYGPQPFIHYSPVRVVEDEDGRLKTEVMAPTAADKEKP